MGKRRRPARVGKLKDNSDERDPGLLKQYPRNKKVDVKIHGCLGSL
jgi:hypothetical protein